LIDCRGCGELSHPNTAFNGFCMDCQLEALGL
jgi:hypothetical protein